jgi:hypothetical protein
MVIRLVRTLFASPPAHRCWRCNDPLHPGDQIAFSAGLCAACRLDPTGRI